MWYDESQIISDQAITPKSMGFELVLTNEDDRMFLCNFDYYRKNGTDFFEPNSIYGKKKHADVRDVLIDYNQNPPVMWIATDGGVYKNFDWFHQNIPDIFYPSSEGLNATMVDQLSVAQQPPFYIATGVYHSSYQAYDPSQGIWHFWPNGGDGKLGLIPFLYKDLFLFNSINSNTDRYKNFVSGFNDVSIDDITSKGLSTVFAFSENNQNQAFCLNASTNPSNINTFRVYDNFLPNPLSANISRSINLSNDLLDVQQSIIPIPNNPDRVLLITSNQNNLRLIFIHQVNTSPNVEQIIELPQITTSTGTFSYPGQLVYVTFDPIIPNKFFLVYRSYARWGDSGAYSKGVIFEYNPDQNSFSDITYNIEGEQGFPKSFIIKDLILDRQTGYLYISTNVGAFYNDRISETWKKHSCNLPYYPGDLDACHCNGKIFIATGYRGIWESSFIRQQASVRNWVIQQSATWNHPMNLFCTLVIEPGVTLTVKNKLRVFGNQKIIVKPGAQLIIDGGIITSECDNLWQGIEVWGNRNQHQYSVNGNYLQGLLVLKNGAVIENAREAVVLFNPNDGSGGYQTSGGIVQATDAVFRNNKRSAQFISYRNFHPLQPSQERNNASFFTRCTFEITQALLGNEPFTDFVTLWDVRGVSFAGCAFQNNGPVHVSPVSSGRGIYSHNAHYLVRPFCPTLACNTPQRSTFKNLRVGIWASQSGGNRSFSSTHALFEHCQVGIVNDGVSNATIQNNEFKPGSHPAGSGFIHTGLALLNTITNYTVRNNLFYEATNPTSPVTIGIWNSNTGISNKTILNNTYQNLFIGNHAQGLNRDPSVGGTQGLEFQCNTHLQGDYDFLVTDGPQPTNGFGIKPTQGSNQAPAGNKFSNNGNVPQYGDFNNASSTPITYFYYPNDFYQNPQDISPNVTKSLVFSENLLCGNPITGFNNLSQLVLTFNNYNQQYSNWKNLLTSLIDGGNTPGIKNRINTAPVNETLILRQELLSKAPYLSDEVLKEAADRTELLPEAILFEVLLANPNALKSGKLMQHLRNKAQPLPDWMLAILEASKGQITLRTLIESAVGYYSALRSDAIRDIITWYEENDSLYSETEVRGWYAQYGNYQADMVVVESFIKQGLYTQAESFMQSVPFTYTLSDWEKADWENYVDFMEIYMSALQSGKKEHQLDTADIYALQQLADIPLPYTGSARARALLNFFYGYNYWEDPYMPVEKSMKTGPQNHVDEVILKTEVYPNPTSDWISFSYCYSHVNEPLVLHVINAQGVSVLKEKLSEKCGVHIIETSEFKPGLYTYYIYSSVEKLANGCFIKN